MRTLKCKYCQGPTFYMGNRTSGMCESCRLRKIELSQQLSKLINLEKSRNKRDFLVYVSELILIKELEDSTLS